MRVCFRFNLLGTEIDHSKLNKCQADLCRCSSRQGSKYPFEFKILRLGGWLLLCQILMWRDLMKFEDIARNHLLDLPKCTTPQPDVSGVYLTWKRQALPYAHRHKEFYANTKPPNLRLKTKRRGAPPYHST